MAMRAQGLKGEHAEQRVPILRACIDELRHECAAAGRAMAARVARMEGRMIGAAARLVAVACLLVAVGAARVQWATPRRRRQ